MKNYNKMVSNAESRVYNAISKLMEIGYELLNLTEYADDYIPTYTTDGLTFVSKYNESEELPFSIVLEDAKKNKKKARKQK
jgi:hypothetical protein